MKNLVVLAILFASAPSFGMTVNSSVSKGACTSTESWKFSSQITKENQELFRTSILSRTNMAMGLSEAQAFINQAQTGEQKVFGVYWRLRAYFQENLHHLAWQGVNWILSQPINPKWSGIQMATWECAHRILTSYPSFLLGDKAKRRFREWSYFFNRNKDYESTYFLSVMTRETVKKISQSDYRTDLGVLISNFEGFHPYDKLVKGLWYARQGQYSQMLSILKPFENSKVWPKTIEGYRPGILLALGKAYFSEGKYAETNKVLKQVDRQSNHMVRVMTEVAWANLMLKDYQTSVGIAMGFQAGGFQQTFAPDAIMVIAMALNELCQYPAALKSIRFWRKNFRGTYHWLARWEKSNSKGGRKIASKGTPLYEELFAYLKDKESKIPRPVLSEWMRSGEFLSHQDEINLVQDEKARLKQMRVNLLEEYRRLVERKKELKEKWISYKPMIVEKTREWRKADPRRRRGKKVTIFELDVPQQVKDEYIEASTIDDRIKNVRAMVKTFKKVVIGFERASRRLERNAKQSIESDLRARNVFMLSKLRSLARNNAIIEVEIYNGASEDIVWRNSNPDYVEYLEKVQDEQDKKLAPDTYDWGEAPKNEDGFVEIWGDELGSMLANVRDNCSSKEKYLEVRFKREL